MKINFKIIPVFFTFLFFMNFSTCIAVECKTREYSQIKDTETKVIKAHIDSYKTYYELNIKGAKKLMEIGDYTGSIKYAEDAKGCELEIEKMEVVLKKRGKLNKK